MSEASIQLGSHVFLRNCIAGEPGIVHAIDRKGYASVEWTDMPEVARWMHHHIDTLIIDESFSVRQLDLFEELAA